jgi:hypothetical protein
MSAHASQRLRALAFAVACLVAGSAPLWADASAMSSRQAPVQPWSTLVDPGFTRAPLTARDLAFASAQAGPIARFHRGAERLLVRQVAEASRSLHPAADCLRALGYQVERLPSSQATTPGASVWLARRNGESTRIEEWLVDARGRRFAEVGAWYWPALLGRSEGPWVAYVLSAPHGQRAVPDGLRATASP